MNRFKIFLLVFSISLFNCSHYKPMINEGGVNNEHYVLSTLWMETSAECKALQIQAYNTATQRIGQYVINEKIKGNEAVVLDIDETVLQTTLYQVEMIMGKYNYPVGWDDFINKSDCKPIHGSIEFLRYADSLGFRIFYVSNRTEDQRKSLTVNLMKYDFPQVSESNILLKTTASGKDERRALIGRKHNIIIYIGDNLGDFSDFMNRGSYKERINSVYEMSNYFGDKFIILPNSTYGDWEGSLIPGYWKLSDSERDRVRKDILESLINN